MEAVLPASAGVRRVLHVAWPVMVSMLSLTIMNVVSTLFLGRLGTAPLAAAGLAVPAAHLAFSVGLGLARAVQIEVAQRTGARDDAAIQRMFWQALWLAAIVGLPTALLSGAGPPVLQLLGAPAEVLPHADAFFFYRVIGAPFLVLSTALSGWFSGRGDTRTPMVSALLANLLNVLFDIVLIFGLGPIPALGAGGAGLAGSLSTALGALWLLWQARGLVGASLGPDRALLGRLVHLGGPNALNNVLGIGGFLLFASVLARVGEAELAAHVIVIRIISVSFLPGFAIGEAASVLVGQAIGARRPDEALAAWRSAMLVGVAFMVGCGVIFVVMPEPLIAIFGPDPAVRDVARRLLLVAVAFQLTDAVTLVTRGALAGAGQTRLLMILETVTTWLIQIPAGWGLALLWGAVGAWLGLVVESLFGAILLLWWVRRGLEAETAGQ